MKKKFFKSSSLFLTASLFTLANGLYANDISRKDDFYQTIIAQDCFVKGANFEFKILSKKDNFLLIQAKNSDLMNLRDQKGHSKCGNYRDVSDNWMQYTKLHHTQSIQNTYANKILRDEIKSIKSHPKPDGNTEKFEISHSKHVEELLTYFNAQEMWERLLKLTSFKNRFANSQEGVDAAHWIKQYAEDLAKETGHKDMRTELVATGRFFIQPSVVITVPGTEEELDAIVVGGHMDTTNGFKPGADDDGSGSATALEVMRAVLTSGKKFKRTIYFIWYAAEEQGLVGSSYVVKKFIANNVKLKGVLHLDMTGYQKTPENKIYLLDDYVDAPLSSFVEKLATTYAKVDVGHTTCGYACSDHASWKQRKYPAAATLEGKFEDGSPYIHTMADKPDTISVEHMSRFAKIGIAFVGEMAEPV